MNNALIREYGLPLLLLVLSLLVGLIAFSEWVYIQKDHWKRMAVFEETGSGKVVLESLSEEQFTLPAISEYSKITEHPLFIEGRLPIEEADDSEPIVAARTDLKMKYMGYIATPEGELGMFLDETTQKYRKLEKGTVVEGWRVDALYPDRATLMQGGSEEELVLRKPKPKIAPRIRPKRTTTRNPFKRQPPQPVKRKNAANPTANND